MRNSKISRYTYARSGEHLALKHVKDLDKFQRRRNAEELNEGRATYADIARKYGVSEGEVRCYYKEYLSKDGVVGTLYREFTGIGKP